MRIVFPFFFFFFFAATVNPKSALFQVSESPHSDPHPTFNLSSPIPSRYEPGTSGRGNLSHASISWVVVAQESWRYTSSLALCISSGQRAVENIGNDVSVLTEQSQDRTSASLSSDLLEWHAGANPLGYPSQMRNDVYSRARLGV